MIDFLVDHPWLFVLYFAAVIALAVWVIYRGTKPMDDVEEFVDQFEDIES